MSIARPQWAEMALALLKEREMTIPEVIKEVENGLPVSSLNAVRDELELSDNQLSHITAIFDSRLVTNAALLDGWDARPVSKSSQTIGEKWVRDGKSPF